MRQFGIAELREGHDAYEASNTSISRPHFLAMLAEALVEAGESHEALATLDEARSHNKLVIAITNLSCIV